MNPWPKRLRALRRKLGCSQAALANRLEVHPSTVSKWEQGLMVPHRVFQGKIVELEEGADG